MRIDPSPLTDRSGRFLGQWGARPGLLVAAIAIAAYLPALTAGFNADDYLILWRIKSIEGLESPFAYFKFAFYEYFRPLGFLSFALDWRLWQLNAFGFHLTNVLLHAANSFLVYTLFSRLTSLRAAAMAAVLFALHPASHEVVYWVAARFDLLATCFILVSLSCLTRQEKWWRVAGVIAFGFALLSKESAISLLIIAPAWDVLIAKRDWRATARRLLPLVGILVAYGVVRSLGADLDAAGGARRLPKLVMTIAAVGGVLWLAWRLERLKRSPAASLTRSRSFWLVAAGMLLFVATLLTDRGAPDWISEKLAFIAHVFFYSLTPVVFPAPAQDFFWPASHLGALPHVVLVVVLCLAAWSAWRSARLGRGEDAFIAVFIAASLLPVSSMTGGLRYLYLSSAGVALLAGVVFTRLSKPAQLVATAVAVAFVAVSIQQIFHAGRAWRAASTLTRDGVALMAGSIRQCGVDDVLLVTTPVAIGNVYANLSWDAFDVIADCAPRSFTTLLRVVRSDLHATLSSVDPQTVELRVHNYSGNIVASQDLRNFILQIEPGDRTTTETTAGTLRTFPEGTTQVFRLTMTPAMQTARRFYYSDGRIRP